MNRYLKLIAGLVMWLALCGFGGVGGGLRYRLNCLHFGNDIHKWRFDAMHASMRWHELERDGDDAGL